MNRKAFTGVEIKSESEGRVRAVFSTLGVVDKDGDVTVKGAIKSGTPVRISAYNHKSWEGALPVGKGVITEEGNELVLESQFFMNTTHGRDTFETVKGLGDIGEWSYGFDVTDSEAIDDEGAKSYHAPGMPKPRRLIKSLAVHEVSPVLLGAGVGTRTVEAKGEKKTFVEQLSEVVASVKAVHERATEVVALRAEKGKGLGDESLALVKGLCAELDAVKAELGPLMAAAASETKASDMEAANSELRAAFLRFTRDHSEGE